MNNQLKPQDLRYGNLIEVQGKIIAKVIEIKERSIRVEYLRSDTGLIHKPIQTFDQISPIPLTEEILLMAGFKKGLMYKKFITKDFDINILIPFIDQKEFYFMPSATVKWGRNLYSLHELQNLINSLTGEELEINLK